MSQKTSGPAKTKNNLKDNLESLRDNNSFFDQFFGSSPRTPDYGDYEPFGFGQEKKKPVKTRQEFHLFNYQDRYEQVIVKKEMKELKERIDEEIKLIKKADKALLNEVKDIENMTVESLPDKPGKYHVRFLEMILGILRALRAKIGESRTWLAALQSKRKKRGSLFAVRTKTKGTQYSLSQELQTARSVQ